MEKEIILLSLSALLFLIFTYRIRQNNVFRKLIYWKDFEDNWLHSKKGEKTGYKYQDRAGCYVFFIYNKKHRPANKKRYADVYVGQSVHMYKRVHDHINGKGNGNVFADIREGKWVYIRFFPCSQREMNKKEIYYINMFGATDSYNQTKGGGYER